jgi:hypothetical protein
VRPARSRRPGATALLVLATILLAGCTSSKGTGPSPPKPGDRVLALAMNPRQVPPATVADFLAAFELAHGAGARGNAITYQWSALESDTGHLDVRRARDDVSFTVSRGMQLFFGIQLINTTAKEVPLDLRTTPFDAPRMKARFHTLIDSLAIGVLPSTTYLSIGNEVDTYLATTNGWTAYANFYADAVAYVHAKAPGVKVGVTTQYSGLAGPDRAKIAALNTASDVDVFTYYALGPSFHPTGPTSARAAFPEMVTFADGKPVILQELGYPSAPLLESSEAEQAAFFTDAIAAWAATDAATIPFLSIFLLHDLTQEQCDTLGSYYGFPDSAELEAFLCSLGLRKVDGTPKAAWGAVTRAARDAGLP